jgi:hypothetical protein
MWENQTISGWELIAAWSYGWYEDGHYKNTISFHYMCIEICDTLNKQQCVSKFKLEQVGGPYFDYTVHPYAEC